MIKRKFKNLLENNILKIEFYLIQFSYFDYFVFYKVYASFIDLKITTRGKALGNFFGEVNP